MHFTPTVTLQNWKKHYISAGSFGKQTTARLLIIITRTVAFLVKTYSLSGKVHSS
jgi:hypothetical protein